MPTLYTDNLTIATALTGIPDVQAGGSVWRTALVFGGLNEAGRRGLGPD